MCSLAEVLAATPKCPKCGALTFYEPDREQWCCKVHGPVWATSVARGGPGVICQRCGHRLAAEQAREVKVGAGYKRLCGDCANAWDGRHDQIEAGLAKREQDRRCHNSERLAALDAETPARPRAYAPSTAVRGGRQ